MGCALISENLVNYEDQLRGPDEGYYKGPDAYRFAIPVDTVPPRNSHNENEL